MSEEYVARYVCYDAALAESRMLRSVHSFTSLIIARSASEDRMMQSLIQFGE